MRIGVLLMIALLPRVAEAQHFLEAESPTARVVAFDRVKNEDGKLYSLSETQDILRSRAMFLWIKYNPNNDLPKLPHGGTWILVVVKPKADLQGSLRVLGASDIPGICAEELSREVGDKESAHLLYFPIRPKELHLSLPYETWILKGVSP